MSVRTTIASCALLLAAAVPALAQSAPVASMSASTESRISFDGTSTVRAFTCRAIALTANVETSAPAVPNASIQNLVRSGEVSVPVEKIDCGNGKMNEHMRNALKATTHPLITFRLDSYNAPDGNATKILGRLTIAGTENPIEVPATVYVDAGGKLRVQGNKEIRMTEYGVKPPSLFLGTMKVRDPVVVHFDLMFTQ